MHMDSSHMVRNLHMVKIWDLLFLEVLLEFLMGVHNFLWLLGIYQC